MPQASQELRDEWWHDGDEDPIKRAVKFLQAAGYKFNRDWTWTAPQPPRDMADKEARAIQYLIDEWDFGGVRKP
jgi:hypothetical protein